MSDWLKVKAADVVELIERRKNRLPWGYRPEQIYRCLIFQKDGLIPLKLRRPWRTIAICPTRHL